MNKEINILVYSPDDVEIYAEAIRKAGYTSVRAASTPAEAEEKLEGTEVILCWKFPLELLSRPEASSVRWIQSMGAGVDDLVRSAHIGEEVLISRIVDQYSVPMAEYVFSHLLYLHQDMARGRRAQAEKKWDPFVTELLAGKTMGVAGLGSIGSEMIRKARAFDMTVHGLSYSGKQAHLVDRHYGPADWEAFVRELDILVMVLPLTDQTRRIMNRDLLLAMKPSSILVNIGRGHSLVEADLVDVMREGHLRAAILDVFEVEPLPANSLLWELPNVYVTPHMSGVNTDERIIAFFLQNLTRYQAGEGLNGMVNRQAGY